jgi:ABC-type nickel/cobalt efflux system permease component RcnA
MRILAAILNLVAGALIALAGGFVVIWCGSFLSAAPRDHWGAVASALLTLSVGIYLVIGGLGHVRLGAIRLQGRRNEQGDY